MILNLESAVVFVHILEFCSSFSFYGGMWLFQQVGQQNLALGLKFNAKAVLDCFEKELEILPNGRRREIDFKMVEGDFQLFQGKWSIEQVNYHIKSLL